MPENTITIDGSEYAYDSLEDEAKVCITHLTQIQNEMEMLKMKLVQLNAANGVFLLQLKESLPDTEDAQETGT